MWRSASSGELRATAFIGWDLAAPGTRVHDIAHVCWQYLDLGPMVTDIGKVARSMRLIVDSHELSDRQRLVSTILWWQDRCWRGIESQADAGDAAMAGLRNEGALSVSLG